MKLVRFSHKNKIMEGVLSDGRVLERGDRSGRTFSLEEVKLLAPLLPSKIVCVGLNYRDHASELGMKIPDEPVIFLKPPTAVIGPLDMIVYPASARRVDYEAELGVVIGKTAKRVPCRSALEYVAGYVCFNDVTARDIQKTDGQWTRSKSFDTFAPIGPWIETELDPSDIAVRTYLNGSLMQDSRTAELIFDVPYLVSFISSIMTLLPGDVIATGTPPGVGPMLPGEEVTVEVEGIGELVNRVSSQDAAGNSRMEI
ncbi:MAG: fumarylacetoacetate hydrolase family protein [Candidatus Omnitrophica bacterium]|nr:fumarylacetoacetate hydrolase family protein [Candidatus Omnitrophota bacterium]